VPIPNDTYYIAIVFTIVIPFVLCAVKWCLFLQFLSLDVMEDGINSLGAGMDMVAGSLVTEFSVGDDWYLVKWK